MVGSAVGTMVWSRAGRNIVSNRLIRMVRTSLWVSGALGTIGGASLRSMTSLGFCVRSPAMVSGNDCRSAGLCRSYLFIGCVFLIGGRRQVARNSGIGNYIGGKAKPR